MGQLWSSLRNEMKDSIALQHCDELNKSLEAISCTCLFVQDIYPLCEQLMTLNLHLIEKRADERLTGEGFFLQIDKLLSMWRILRLILL